jgi:hypothetical protein
LFGRVGKSADFVNNERVKGQNCPDLVKERKERNEKKREKKEIREENENN